VIFYLSPDDFLRDGFTHRDYKDAGLFVIGNDDGSRGVIFPLSENRFIIDGTVLIIPKRQLLHPTNPVSFFGSFLLLPYD